MYTKMKKVNDDLINHKLESYCNDLLQYNEDAVFAILKRYEEKGKKISQELKTSSVILSSIPVDELTLSSPYSITEDGYLKIWCEDEILCKIIHAHISFEDAVIKGKKVKDFYLDLNKEEIQDFIK